MAKHAWKLDADSTAVREEAEVLQEPLQKADAQLMVELREGVDCFGELLTRYRNPIVQFMYRLVQVPAIAEELAQNVFLILYRSRLTYQIRDDFTVWIYRIATHIATQHLCKSKEFVTGVGSRADLSAPEENTRAIQAGIMSLPERERIAVVLHKYQQVSLAHIGQILELNDSELPSLLFKAYRTLTDFLRLKVPRPWEVRP